MWHQLPYDVKRKPAQLLATALPRLDGRTSWRQGAWSVRIPAGVARSARTGPTSPVRLGQRAAERTRRRAGIRDRRAQRHQRRVHGVRRRRRLSRRALVAARGLGVGAGRTRSTHPHFWERADGRWLWRGMFERVPLPPAWPVYVTWAEARAYATWRGLRLPTEAEFHRAAYGTRGDRAAVSLGRADARAAAGQLRFRPLGSRAGRQRIRTAPAPSACTIWSATAGSGRRPSFAPFAGFEPLASYPEYSADFFDGEHFVMKGASPVTARGAGAARVPQLVPAALSRTSTPRSAA